MRTYLANQRRALISLKKKIEKNGGVTRTHSRTHTRVHTKEVFYLNKIKEKIGKNAFKGKMKRSGERGVASGGGRGDESTYRLFGRLRHSDVNGTEPLLLLLDQVGRC
jgi:hypothetical protein